MSSWLASAKPMQVIGQWVTLILLDRDYAQASLFGEPPKCFGIKQKQVLTPVGKVLKSIGVIEGQERVF